MKITLRGNGGSIEIIPVGKPFYNDGYKLDQQTIDVISECRGYSGRDQYLFFVSDIQDFMTALKLKQESLMAGKITICDYEDHFRLSLEYDKLGNVEVSVDQAQVGWSRTKLQFEFVSDQTWIAEFLSDLQSAFMQTDGQ